MEHIPIDTLSGDAAWDECLICGSADLDGPCPGEPEPRFPDYPLPRDDFWDEGDADEEPEVLRIAKELMRRPQIA